MPIYEYRCDPCQHRFEAFLTSSTEQALCPKCQGTKLNRLMSTFAATVQGGYKSSQGMLSPSQSLTNDPMAAKPSTGCGGGCACH